MIDRRNTYRAVQRKPYDWQGDRQVFRLQFRRWFSPFWKDTFDTGSIEEIVRTAELHAAPFKPRVMPLGKFPRAIPEPTPTEGEAA